MTFVFFIYGLAFFVLGMAIFIYPKKDSAFKLAEDLSLIGVFGILHGINEWIDMFIYIQKPEELLFLKLIRAFIMPLSFVFLIQFGVKVIGDGKKGFAWIRSLTFILPFAWLLIFALSRERFLYGDIWGRYLLGFPGAMLAACALVYQLPYFNDVRFTSTKKYLKISVFFFALYAVLAGAIAPDAGFLPASVFNYTWFLDTFGFPVQILRALSAVVIAVFIGKSLAVFNSETKVKLKDLVCGLKKANEEIEASQKELQIKNKELSASNEEMQAVNEQIKANTEALEASNEELIKAKQELENKYKEMEEFHKITMGREKRIIELKDEIERMKEGRDKK